MASWIVHLTLELSVRFQVLCSGVRHFTLMLPFSSQMYKCVPANFNNNAGGTL